MGDLSLDAWGLLKDLLRVDTTNPPGNEKAAADLVARFLDSHGVPYRVVEKAPGRSNVVGRVGEGGGPVLFSAHLDTVPAGPGPWDRPPFAAEETGGYLVGRGALDVKNGVAMGAALLAAAKAKGGLKRPVVFAAVADEETGCEFGSRYLVERHHDLVKAEYFLGEGGGMTQWVMGRKVLPIGAGEKGQMIIRVTFEGAGGHASVPSSTDAVFRLGRFLARLGKGLPVRVTPAATRFVEAMAEIQGGAAGIALRAMKIPPIASALASRLPPPTGPAVRAMLSNTASPTRLFADGAPNAIPSVIACDFDIRTLPGMTTEQVLAELFDAGGDKGKVEVLHESPAVEVSTDTPLFQHLKARAKALVPDAEPLPILIPGYTDAKWFSKSAEHCYGFMPLLNSDPAEAARFRTLLHGPNERISKDAFLAGYRLLEDAVLSFATR